MEDKIFDIVTDLIREDITKDEAIDKLLILYNVSGSFTMKVEQMEFVPEEPYLSDVISWEKGNIWELHELFPDSQNIEVRINKNYR